MQVLVVLLFLLVGYHDQLLLKWCNDSSVTMIQRQLVQLRGRGTMKSERERDLYNYQLKYRKQQMNYLLNHQHSWSVLHNPSEERKPKVFYTIFAGREAPLRIQFEYIQEMLDKKIIDEVHIWDYTCYKYNTNGAHDKKFILNTLWPMDDRIYYIRSQTCGWYEYYRFYHDHPLRPRDVLIKADDDIVFIDTSRFAGFVRTIRHFRRTYLWSANIINNGMSAAFQELDGVLDGGLVVPGEERVGTNTSKMIDIEPSCPNQLYSCLSMNGTRGDALHQSFLEAPANFTTPVRGKELRLMKGRCSINFIAWLGENFPRTLTHLHNNPHGDAVGGNDEVALTLGVAEIEQNVVYMPLVVAHGSFGTQGLWENNYAFKLYREAMPKLKNITSTWKFPPNKLRFPTIANA